MMKAMLADRADVALLAVAVLGLLSGLGLLAAGGPMRRRLPSARG